MVLRDPKRYHCEGKIGCDIDKNLIGNVVAGTEKKRRLSIIQQRIEKIAEDRIEQEGIKEVDDRGKEERKRQCQS